MDSCHILFYTLYTIFECFVILFGKKEKQICLQLVADTTELQLDGFVRAGAVLHKTIGTGETVVVNIGPYVSDRLRFCLQKRT